MNATAPDVAAPSAWSPLSQPTFRSLWLAILVGNIGTWINDVAASWVMAENTGSPFMVAAVQTATTLPMVLLAVFAGALADIVDRRKFLIAAQLWMLVVASGLALAAHWDVLTPWLLVGLTFCLGIGAAMAAPAQQAVTPELVPRPMLGPAVALGSLSMNIARSIGPALGGLIVAQWSVAAAFAVNALSFLGIVIVLALWRRAPAESGRPPEHFGTALRAGVRYVVHASPLQAVLAKAGLFFVFASGFTALLAIVVKQELSAGAGAYGILLGCFGIGAIAGALCLPRIRSRVDPDRLVLIASLVFAATLGALAMVRTLVVLYPACLIAGFAWISVLSSFHIAAQTSSPAWVRARALSLYIVVFSGGLAAGSLIWGLLAEQTSPRLALLAAAGATAVAALVGRRFKLGAAAQVDVTPSGHWPEPVVEGDEPGERGPVLVTVEYRVRPDAEAAFHQLLHALGRSRRRDGAIQWGVMEDVSAPGTFLEYFVTSSWLDHLRQHDRVTVDDRELQVAIAKTQVDGYRPHVRHFVGGAGASPRDPTPRPMDLQEAP